MKKIIPLIVFNLTLMANGCFYQTKQPKPKASAQFSPCKWPDQSRVITSKKNELHQVWEIENKPILYSHLLPNNSSLYSFRSGVRQRIKVLDPFKRFEASKPTSPPGGEAYNPYLAMSKQAGILQPITCLEALLLGEQTARKPMLTEPTEFGAFILKRKVNNKTTLKIYYSTNDQPGLRLNRKVTEMITQDKSRGWLLFAHIHNHNFFFDKKDAFASPSPSKTDVQMARRFRDSLQLQQLWVTNGFHTIHIDSSEFNKFKAHGD